MKRLVRQILFFIPVTITMLLGACHLEQGKLHFDELKLNPITVYTMGPLETTIYCLAEGSIPTGETFSEMHRQSLNQVEVYPETADWGELVCLSLSEPASIKQIKDTSNVLLLVLATRKDSHGAVRGFRNLLDQRMRLLQEINNLQNLLITEKTEGKNEIIKYEQKIADQIQVTVDRERTINDLKQTIKDLEQQVRKLKEVELLLQPNKTTQ